MGLSPAPGDFEIALFYPSHRQFRILSYLSKYVNTNLELMIRSKKKKIGSEIG